MARNHALELLEHRFNTAYEMMVAVTRASEGFKELAEPTDDPLLKETQEAMINLIVRLVAYSQSLMAEIKAKTRDDTPDTAPSSPSSGQPVPPEGAGPRSPAAPSRRSRSKSGQI